MGRYMADSDAQRQTSGHDEADPFVAAGASRRSVLLAVATEVFDSKPYSEIFVEEIANRVGVATSLIYYYFGNKHGLLAGVVRNAAEGLETAVADAPTADALIDAYVAFAVREPAQWRHITTVAPRDHEIEAILAAHREQLIGRVAAVALGGVADERSQLMIDGWLGFVERLVRTRVAGAGDVGDLATTLKDGLRRLL